MALFHVFAGLVNGRLHRRQLKSSICFSLQSVFFLFVCFGVFLFCFVLFFNKFIYSFIYFWLCWVFIAVRGLFSSCSEPGLLFVAVRGLLTAVGSLVAEHRLQMCRLQ